MSDVKYLHSFSQGQRVHRKNLPLSGEWMLVEGTDTYPDRPVQFLGIEKVCPVSNEHHIMAWDSSLSGGAGEIVHGLSVFVIR